MVGSQIDALNRMVGLGLLSSQTAYELKMELLGLDPVTGDPVSELRSSEDKLVDDPDWSLEDRPIYIGRFKARPVSRLALPAPVTVNSPDPDLDSVPPVPVSNTQALEI